MTPVRLEGPADTGDAGIDPEHVVSIEGEAVASESEGEVAPNTTIPDPEHPAAALPPMHICADELTGGDLDELQAIRKVHRELETLQKQVQADADADAASGLVRPRIRALKAAAASLLEPHFIDRVQKQGREIGMLEGKFRDKKKKQQRPEVEAYAQGTASTPMSMYSPDMWAMCFPILFPYGDGVFGLPRETPLTFQQCMGMHLLREELSYAVTKEDVRIGAAWSVDDHPEVFACDCEQCGDPTCAFTPPSQSRWGACRELLCCYYDSWRRMEQIRKAKGHVMRTGFRERLETICGASWQKIDAAIVSLGPGASIKDVLLSAQVDPDVKAALSELMVFTTDICGSDGAMNRMAML